MAQRVVIPGFRKIETIGSGEGGITNYNDLTNKPSINNVPLVGNLNTVDLKLTDATLKKEGVPAEAKTVGDKLEAQSTSLTALSEQLGSHTVKSDVPENAVFTDTVYDYSALLGYDIYNLVSLKDATYPANKVWLSKDFIAPFDGYIFFMVQTDATSGAFSQVFKEDDVLTSDNQKMIADFNTWGCAYNYKIFKGKTYHFHSYTNTATAFNKVMLCIRKKFEIPTEYIPYAPSNVVLAEENSQQSKEMIDIKMLGWSVPRECPVQNEANGNQFVQKVGRVDLGSLEWGIQTTGDDFFYSADISTNLKKQIGYTENWGYCVDYSIIKFDKSTSKTKVIFADNVGNIFVRDTRYTTEKDLQTALHGVYLYYELATPITTTIDGNEIGETVSDVRKETTVNLLKPTLETTTVNGVTCTNNGDGTYMLNGTNSTTDFITLPIDINLKLSNGLYKIIGNSSTNQGCRIAVNLTSDDWILSDEDNPIFNGSDYIKTAISVIPNASINNVVLKPMITTNLNATYDDFVPYTGDSGSLNGDVADLRDDVDGIEKEVSTQKINIHYGTGDGNNIVPVKGTYYIKTPPILVNNSANTFEDAQEGSSGGGGLRTINYTYAKEGNVKFTILDPLIDVNTNVSGLVVTPDSSVLRNGHYYRIKGTATEDATIPLYSVKNPSSDTLLFVSDLSGEMSEGTFYYLISDTAGNTKQFETEKNKNTVFSGHSGEVKVSLVVKSGTKVSSIANVRAGYSKVYSVMDRSDKKYSDTADTVIDAIMEMKSK